MAKRIADKELTDRNWDQEDEEEESVMNPSLARLLTAAWRGASGSYAQRFVRRPGLEGTDDGTVIRSSLKRGGPTSSPPPPAEVTNKQPNGSAPSLAQSSSSSSSSSSSREYSRQLTALNCSVRDWIAKHVNDNPLCDLNPIFRDYERHLASIEKKYGASAESEGTGGKQEGSQPATATASSASLAPAAGTTTAPALFPQSKEKESTPAPLPAGVSFSFGKKVDSSVLGSLGAGGAPLSFSFSSQSSSTGSLFGGAASSTPAANFSFGAAKTEAAASNQAEDQNGGADEESEEPPKPVVTEVKEDDAFYSKKAACTGQNRNILLNIMVHPSMPCSRMGKNNVMVVCVPNPPVDDKNPSTPCPLLIRVKAAEDADELHKILQEKRE
ncbi:hypothetical protein JZ751_022283 [Albula glossodonta]|uniref:Nuclear pore complex NUP2/50/61 domain-containing protein n=1 Tax=Albula glossodonta TaxID=121402 RepID=A0A8T2NQX9_9TELE|nr:hypothetical protein JZ751_022283 [Albula glossodonta]